MRLSNLLSILTPLILSFILVAIIIAVILFIIKKSKSSKRYTVDYFLNYPESNFIFSEQDGFAFENFIKNLFRAMGFLYVAHPGQTPECDGNKNDHNIDLIFEKNSVTILIQCKCHSNKVWSNSVCATSAALTYASSFIENCRALLVTNNFTLTNRDELNRYQVNCIDKDKLKSIYNLSKFVNSYCFDLLISPASDLQQQNFQYVMMEDLLNIKLYAMNENQEEKFKIEIYDNEVYQRHKTKNSLICNFINDDSIYKGLSSLFSFLNQPILLKGKVLRINNNQCLIKVFLKSEEEKITNDYTELLEKLKPNRNKLVLQKQ